MKSLKASRALAVALMLGACAAFGQEQEGSIELQLPPHVLRQCNEGGGCVLLTRKQQEEDLAAAVQKAFIAGYLKGAIEATQKVVKQGGSP